MEQLANRLASNIAGSLGYDDERRAVIAYGLTAILQIAATILLVLCLGLMVKAPAEALIICFSVSILRKYSGGAHADSIELCTAVSLVYCTVGAIISKLISVYYIPALMAAAILIMYGFSFLILYRKAPVDSPNKPVKTEKKRKRMRKYSFIILSVYGLISVVLFLGTSRMNRLHSLGISMLLGLAWQTFTLTSPGSVLLNKLNGLFIFFRKEDHK